MICRSHIPCYFIIAATEQEGTAYADANGTNGKVMFKVIVFLLLCLTYLRTHSCNLRIHFKDFLGAYLRIHRRILSILKSSKNALELIFSGMQKCILYSENLFNSLHIEIKCKRHKNFLRAK